MGSVNQYSLVNGKVRNSHSIDTPSYFGRSVIGDPSEDVKGPSNAMINHKMTLGFKTHPNALSGEAIGRDFVYGVKNLGNGWAEVTTASNRIKFPYADLYVDGVFSPIHSNEDGNFKGWRDAAVTSPQKFNKDSGEIFYRESPEFKADFLGNSTKLDKYRSLSTYKGPIKEVGKHMSMTHNLNQDVRNVMFDQNQYKRFDSEFVEFIDYLSSKYDSPKNIVEIGTRKMSTAIALQYYPNLKISRLVRGDKFFDKAYREGKLLGFKDVEAADIMKQYDIFHELCHNYHEHMPEVMAEKQVGRDLLEFYTRKADANKGTPKGRMYEKLALWSKYYIENVEEMIRERDKNLESRIEELKVEAIEQGLEGDAVKEYVSRKLGSYKSRDKNSKSMLEEKVDDVEVEERDIESDYVNEDDLNYEERDSLDQMDNYESGEEPDTDVADDGAE